MKNRILLPILLCLIYSFSLQAVCGKVDIGPAYVRVDVLESEKTVRRLNMGAVRADATIVLFDCWGFALKPTFLYGKAKHGELAAGGISLVHYFPICDGLDIAPGGGVNFSHLNTLTDLPPLGLEDLHENFHSISPFLSFEAIYSFCQGWRICGMVQYAWSRTETKIRHIGKFKSKPQGPSYSAMIEYDINPCFSVNLGAAYNLSLTKEKHGIRGAGVKLGFAYWF